MSPCVRHNIAFHTIREGFFLVPVSPPVHFEGVENRNFFFWTCDFVNSTFLSGRFCEQHGCTAKHVHSYMARLSEVYVFMYCAPVYIHQHIDPTIVCAEFVTWVVVLLFMPKGSHFDGMHTSSRKRQRNLTAHHYRRFFFLSNRPPVHFGDHELKGTKKRKASLTEHFFTIFTLLPSPTHPKPNRIA